jgi:hypothetical protein
MLKLLPNISQITLHKLITIHLVFLASLIQGQEILKVYKIQLQIIILNKTIFLLIKII